MIALSRLSMAGKVHDAEEAQQPSGNDAVRASGRWISLKALLVMLLVLAAGLSGGYILGANSASSQISLLDSEMTTAKYQISQLLSQVSALQMSGNETVYISGSLNELYEAVKDSIVTVQGLVAESYMFGRTVYSEVLGSGFVVNLTGTPLIVTNYHVIEGMVNGSITFINGEAYPFIVLGADKYSDLAILRVADAPEELLRPLAVASSDILQVGDVVVAIGNPYGLQSSLTSGIVSQLNRAIQTETSGSYLIAGVIQITTPINPGNSGGPLFDAMGRVVGITSAIISDADNLGFAVSSDSLINEIQSLVAEGSYSHPLLGISGVAVDYLTSNALGLNVTYGVLIQAVTVGSPADSAGLVGGTKLVTVAGERIYSGGDIIIMADGQRIRSMDDLTSYLDLELAPGMTVNLTVMRGNDAIIVPVVLGAYS